MSGRSSCPHHAPQAGAPDTGQIGVSTPRPNGISTPLSWRVRFAMWRARMQLNAGLRLDWLWLTRRGAEGLVKAGRLARHSAGGMR